MRRIFTLMLALSALVGAGATSVALDLSAAAGSPSSSGAVAYSVGTPSLASIADGTTAAPWNEYQGDPGSPSYSSVSPGTVLPTYTPGGAVTTTGGVSEPNIAVYPGASTGTANGAVPYAAGVVGTPGTLDGYCGTGSDTTEASSTTLARQPSGTTLPLAPAYFPHVIRNADGSLTGYFDYRPKDADEAIVAATSTDSGRTWTYDGEALEENPSYCPVADTTDDGEGHENVMTINGNTYLYTLPRAAGDNIGVGMIIHQFTPSEADPLAGLPATEAVGIDPDAFVPTGTGPIDLSTTSSTAIPLTSLGTAGSPEQLIAGSFIDLTQNPIGSVPVVINCGVTAAGASPALTGCSTTAGSVTVDAGDLIEQVLGFTTKSSDIGTVPAGPNNTLGTGGTTSLTIDPVQATVPADGYTENDFTNPTTAALFNADAPLRLYLNGTALYCTGANSYQTNHLEDCTAGSDNPAYSISSPWEPITGDPIIPATSYDPASGDGMTSGLVAPDGIVGTLPSYPNDGSVPSDATYVMYTEKVLNYFVAGAASATSATAFSTLATTGLNFYPGSSFAEDLPSSISAQDPVTVTLGDNTLAGESTPVDVYVPVTCTGLTSGGTNAGTGLPTETLTGCTVPSTIAGTPYSPSDTFASNAEIAAPGAALVPPATLALTGEGSLTSAKKLFKNNEDLSVLRVAWTTDGVNFSDHGLANGGIISGSSNGAVDSTGAVTCTAANATSVSSYQDINNPCSTESPTNLNAYAGDDAANGTGPSTGGTDTNGTADLDEMRWVGSAGSIIVNPDGTYGLFLSGAWAADGDSDAFNQVFYSSSTNGEDWSVPVALVSTDYSFAASIAQDSELAAGQDDPLGISAYYSGRAYAPSVVQNPDGTLTMVFSGDRIPKSIAPAGSVLGTGSSQYTIGATDPALYRNILAVTLTSATSPGVPTTTAVSSNVSPTPTLGSPVTYVATVAPQPPGTGTPTGTVSFATAVGGPIAGCTAIALDEDSPDTATCTTAYTGPDDNEVQASYSGDSNFATSSSTPLSTTSVTSSDAGEGVVGEMVTYSATVATVGSGPSPSGGVSFTDSAGLITSCSDQSLELVGSSEVATCSISYGAPTSDTITASYLGDEGTLGSSGTLDETIATASTSIAVTPEDNLTSAVVGQSVTYVATVGVLAPGAGTPTGTVTFYGSGGTAITGCTGVALSAGTPDSAACTTSYSGSTTDDVTATYSGDSNFSGSSSSAPLVETVNPAGTTTTLSASDNGQGVVVGQSVTFAATVSVNAPGAGTPTSTVSFTDAAGLLGTSCANQALSSTLVATCTFAFPTSEPSGDVITATYAGDDTTFTTSLAQLTETILPAPTTTTLSSSDSGNGIVVGQPVTYTASVSVNAPGAGTPTGTVTFYGSEGTAIPGCSNVGLSDGVGDVATCQTSYPATGSNTITATYSGDGNFSTSTSAPITENVTADQTTLSLSASPDPAVTGKSETITGTVLVDSPGAGTPTGTVSFFDGATTLCNGVALGAENQATCSVTYAKIAGSPHSLTATYSGSTNDLPATSNTVSLTVTQATSLKVTATPSPASYGRTISLSGSGLPAKATGTVSFISSSTLLCQATVAGGRAACDVPTNLAPGSYTILGQYSGDTTYAPSSTSIGLMVTKAATSIGARAIPASVPYGTALTLEATKLPAGVTGTVSFKSSTTTWCDVPASSPAVVCAVPGDVGVGTYQVTVTYSGDSNFVGSSATTSFVIRQAHTQFAATATPASVSTGESVTLAANGLPAQSTGAVSFTSAGSTLCTAAVTNGAASCSTSSDLAAGNYHVKASYSGDANYTSSSATTVFVITKPTNGA